MSTPRIYKLDLSLHSTQNSISKNTDSNQLHFTSKSTIHVIQWPTIVQIFTVTQYINIIIMTYGVYNYHKEITTNESQKEVYVVIGYSDSKEETTSKERRKAHTQPV